VFIVSFPALLLSFFLETSTNFKNKNTRTGIALVDKQNVYFKRKTTTTYFAVGLAVLNP